PHDAGHAAQVLHSASRGHNPKSKLEIILVRHSPRDHSVERRLVLRVDRIPNHLEVDLDCGVELEDTESLLGKVVLIRYQIRDVAACFAQPLGFGETKVGLLDPRLRPFPLVDVSDKYIPVQNSPLGTAHGDPTVLKPAVCAIEPMEAMLDI